MLFRSAANMSQFTIFGSQVQKATRTSIIEGQKGMMKTTQFVHTSIVNVHKALMHHSQPKQLTNSTAAAAQISCSTLVLPWVLSMASQNSRTPSALPGRGTFTAASKSSSSSIYQSFPETNHIILLLLVNR